MSAMYGTWEMKPEGKTSAVAQKGQLHVSLHEGYAAVYEGWFPERPRFEPRAVISGVCLWNAGWQIVFEGIGGTGTKALSLALPNDRQEIYQRLDEHHRVVPRRILVPCRPDNYHRSLLQWLELTLKGMPAVEKVLFQIPEDEYHSYIRTLEQKLHRELPELHRLLIGFADATWELMLSHPTLAAKAELVEPMKKGATTENESYALPYEHPEVWGVDSQTVVGIEDLVELRISQEARVRIPVFCGVLALPHPYLEKGGEVTAIEL